MLSYQPGKVIHLLAGSDRQLVSAEKRGKIEEGKKRESLKCLLDLGLVHQKKGRAQLSGVCAVLFWV